MNNRYLIVAMTVLFASFRVFGGMEHASVVAQVVKHVVPYDIQVWNDDFNGEEIIILVGVNETGLVQELGVEQTTGELFARSKFDTVHKLQIEPFVFEGEVMQLPFQSESVSRSS